PLDFYQYWRNIDDKDVEKCLGLLTFLPMDEVRRLGALEGAEINEAKKVLAFEVTKLVHGEEEAQKAAEAALALFAGGANSANIPTLTLTADDLAADARISTMLVKAGLCKSQTDARNQIKAGAVYAADEKVADMAAVVTADMIGQDGLLLRKGKKNYVRLILQ
ncbi:MAG: tyrosine--tRNA ligase, partial [Clostridia bacterium]|nr:tyrosine--tRNA ligase [Clostridia bacterium]